MVNISVQILSNLKKITLTSVLLLHPNRPPGVQHQHPPDDVTSCEILRRHLPATPKQLNHEPKQQPTTVN